ncbi:MAG: histidine-type phosphatase [Chitinophagaceae bacterium]|nr:histidine-type phosphatase [Chitinophagaceae bacterium]
MILRTALLTILTFTLLPNLIGQDIKEEIFNNPEKSGGVYYAYPVTGKQEYSPVPEGYEPFYVSHFGRHGSRYLASDKDYTNIINILKAAKESSELTPVGIELLNRLYIIWEEAEDRGGDLSPLGVRQWKGIADRLYDNYPDLFSKNLKLKARSTPFPRCILSMDAFCEQLKERNPRLDFDRDASNRYIKYLNFHTQEAINYRSEKDTWLPKYREFEKDHVKPERLYTSIFSNREYASEKITPSSFIWQLFWIASDLQNMEAGISLYDYFEKEELFELWQTNNYNLYVNYGPSGWTNGMMYGNAKPTLQNILDEADAAIQSGTYGGSFRFAHDGNIIPLASIMALEGCDNTTSDPDGFYKVWQTYHVVPMAANFQLIFFRNKNNSKDILVRMLHNEKEAKVKGLEYAVNKLYKWEDLKHFYKSRIATL